MCQSRKKNKMNPKRPAKSRVSKMAPEQMSQIKPQPMKIIPVYNPAQKSAGPFKNLG